MAGYLSSPCKNFVLVMTEGGNEIGNGGTEPFTKSLVQYRKFMESWEKDIANSHFLFPCIHIIVFGACISFVGSVFTCKIQSDILVPIIPLFWHPTDIPMQAMAARTFGALRIAVKKLKVLYSRRFPLPESGKRLALGCPYPLEFTDFSGSTHSFSYHTSQILRDKLIFSGKVHDTGRKICIKFVRSYSPEAHQFCAKMGHTPELIAYNSLAAGWNMVVMDLIVIDFPDQPGQYQCLSRVAGQKRKPLKVPITSFIGELHRRGYVHGDLRDNNLFVSVRDNPANFLLIDFDWAGPIGQTYYPMYVNHRDIQRPEDARDGMMVQVQHDLEMLEYIFFDSEPGTPVSGIERAAKRVRVE